MRLGSFNMAVGLVACFPLVSLTTLSAIAQSATSPATAIETDFRAIVQAAKAKVFPSVVYIRCVRESNEEGKKQSQEISGSGVIISAEGEVLTNWHVIDKATSIRFLLSDGRHADGKIIGSDKDTDLALVKLTIPDQPASVSSPEIPFALIGDSTKLSEGDFVMAMGAPWGLNRSVAIGIVSCTRRYLEGVSEYSLYLQTDAAINPGNSGGPLVNTAGEIIGINSRGMSGSADGMGFAIPAETILTLIPQLRSQGAVKWTWLGLQLQALRDFNKDMYFEGTQGVIVAETDPDSPARKAGFQARDRIMRVNGQLFSAQTEEDLPALRRAFGLLQLDQEATFEVQRNNATETLKLTPREKGKVEGDELALERFDFTVKTINQFDNPDLFFQRQSGVFVYGVKWPGNASNSGLSRNDILLKIDGKPVGTIDDVKTIHKDLISRVDTTHRVVVVVLRNGLMRQLVLDFGRDHSKE